MSTSTTYYSEFDNNAPLDNSDFTRRDISEIVRDPPPAYRNVMYPIKEPELKRPYKVIWYPILPWFMVIISFLFLTGTLLENSQNIGYLAGFLISCFLITKYLLPQSADN